MVSSKPIRILHVVGGMDRGGVETWLMHVLRNIDRTGFQMDFLIHTDRPCAYDDEVRSLGSQIIPCLSPSNPIAYARSFMRVVRDHGPYDVVHSHVHHFSGFVLWLAHRAGVSTRIAHSHNDTSSIEAAAGIARKAYLRLMGRLIKSYANAGLAASREAARALYGSRWQSDPRWCVLYCGVDLALFSSQVERFRVRLEFGIPPDSLVVGHAGRFDPQKNHRFLIEVAKDTIRRSPSTRFLLVGDGPDRPAITRLVQETGIAESVIFAGLRSDVPRLMLGAMDLFCMPSLHEGLPVAAIEAQAAGLPCVLSTDISPETSIVPGLVEFHGRHESPDVWAETLIDASSRPRMDPSSARKAVADRGFDVGASVRQLCHIYQKVPMRREQT